VTIRRSQIALDHAVDDPPDAKIPAAPAEDNIRVRRRDRLGGLIHEYSQVA
jgi:hypothetical protein